MVVPKGEGCMKTLLFLSDGYLVNMAAWLLTGVAALLVFIKQRQKYRQQPKKLKWMNAALSAWFLLAALTLPELYCAVFYDETDSFSLTNSSRRWFSIHVQSNQSGFRDSRELFGPGFKEKKNVVFLGDSFTFGHGVRNVDDRFSDRIAQELDANQPGQFLTNNVSLPGLDTRQMVDDIFRDQLAGLKKNDVLVYTFVLNDIEYFDEKTGAFYQNQQSLHPTNFLFRDTYFYNLMYYRVKQISQSGRFNYYDYLQSSYEGEPWNRLARKFDELRHLCAEREIDLRIVIFPFLQNLGDAYPFSGCSST
jgi:hypothetical protein